MRLVFDQGDLHDIGACFLGGQAKDVIDHIYRLMQRETLKPNITDIGLDQILFLLIRGSAALGSPYRQHLLAAVAE